MNNSIQRRLKKFNLEHLKDNPDFINFIDSISKSYSDYDLQIERLSNTLEVSLKKTLDLNQKIKEEAAQDFKSLVEGFPGLVTWFDKNLNYLGANENFLKFTNTSKENYSGKKIGEVFSESQSSNFVTNCGYFLLTSSK